jgi:mRNA-degrading endonuclease RelE of RelBE toxin-antitoxin system
VTEAAGDDWKNAKWNQVWKEQVPEYVEEKPAEPPVEEKQEDEDSAPLMVNATKKFLKEFKGLQAKVNNQVFQIVKKIKKVKNRHEGGLDIKQAEGQERKKEFDKIWRAHSGEYRITYFWLDSYEDLLLEDLEHKQVADDAWLSAKTKIARPVNYTLVNLTSLKKTKKTQAALLEALADILENPTTTLLTSATLDDLADFLEESE